jgi:hypothetical protein
MREDLARPGASAARGFGGKGFHDRWFHGKGFLGQRTHNRRAHLAAPPKNRISRGRVNC